MTAHDVVAVVRRRLETKGVGHAGTLDPLAAGVLPVAVGAFTRLIPYLEGGKTYRAEIAFGRSTTTGDAAGDTIATAPADFDAEALREVLLRFTGTITQRPPAYSAVHVDGHRAYELARAGVAVDVPTRRVEISRLELLAFWPGLARGTGPRALLEVECSAGTYVRSLAEDIGAALGVPAHLAFLLRTRAGAFGVADALLLEEPWEFADVDVALSHLPRLEVEDDRVADLRMGRAIPAPGRAGSIRAMRGSEIVAIGEVREERLWPKTVLPKPA